MRNDKNYLFTIGFAFLFVILSLIAAAYAASTNTVSSNTIKGQDMKIITVSWHDDDTLASGTRTRVNVNGYLHQIITIPHPNGTVAPQDNYDVYLYHHDGTVLSVVGTTLENRDTDNAEMVTPSIPPYIDWVTFQHVNSTVLNATGEVNLYVSPRK